MSSCLFFFFFPWRIYLLVLLLFGGSGSSLLGGLSLAAASPASLQARCSGFSSQWLLLSQSRGSRPLGFSGCGISSEACGFYRVGSRVMVHSLSCSKANLPRTWESSQNMDGTRVAHIGRWILNSCITKEASLFLNRVWESILFFFFLILVHLQNCVNFCYIAK